MITLLNHQQLNVAQQIFNVFQSSYAIEANLIGVSEFPPLKRQVTDILASHSSFYGYLIEGQLAGVVEITLTAQVLEIESLTVNPDFFRQGVAGKLIVYVLSAFSHQTAKVETATANAPAIRLYQKHGFIQYKKWIPDHGIEKVAFSRANK